MTIATGQHATSWVDDRDGNEQLVRQVARYKAKAGAMEELAAIYRTSVIALYSDGSSYGAAHFGPIAQGDIVFVVYVSNNVNYFNHTPKATRLVAWEQGGLSES